MRKAPTITIIAAMDQNRAIGYKNTLPWQLPDDLARFKKLTLGKPVVMGSLTALSLGRALPGRLNIVVTRKGSVPYSGMTSAVSLEMAIKMAGEGGAADVCIIGGGEIYQQTITIADRMFLTHINTTLAEADTYFPSFNADQWHIENREMHSKDDRHALEFEFVNYQRKR